MKTFRTFEEYKQKPAFFDFGSQWIPFIKKYEKHQLVAKELDRILRLWDEMARENFEDTEAYDPETAKAEFELEVREGAVRHRDYLWLTEKFDGIQLSSLVTVMAQILYPNEKWIVLKDDYFDAVITNDSRSMVFDIINFGRLSAGASLFNIGDKKFVADKQTKKEVAAFKKNMHDLISAQFVISIAEYHLMEDRFETWQSHIDKDEMH